MASKSWSKEVEIKDNFEDSALKVVININPMYPDKALKKDMSGKCEIEYIVDLDGAVKSSGIIVTCSPKDIFEESCSKAISLRKFLNKAKREQKVQSSCIYR